MQKKNCAGRMDLSMRYVQPIKDKEQLQEFEDYLKNKNPRDHIMFLLGVNLGLRISDILPLKVKDVRNKQSVKVYEEKTGKFNQIIINHELKRALAEYTKGMKDNDYLIKSRKKTETGRQQHIDRVQAYRILRDAAKAVGYRGDIGTHSLRKTFGYRFYQKSGGDVGALMRLFNHDDQTITLRYIGIEQEQVDDIIMNLHK